MEEFAQIQNKTARLLFLINKLYEEDYILVEELQLMKSELKIYISFRFYFWTALSFLISCSKNRRVRK